jgi:hypothetical protein
MGGRRPKQVLQSLSCHAFKFSLASGGTSQLFFFFLQEHLLALFFCESTSQRFIISDFTKQIRDFFISMCSTFDRTKKRELKRRQLLMVL